MSDLHLIFVVEYHILHALHYHFLIRIYIYRPRSEGYVFTGVCHSFCSKGEGRSDETHKVSGQHLPPPPPRPGPGHNTSLPPPRDQVTTPASPPPAPGTRSQHLPPPPRPQVTTPPRRPPRLHAGGRYASYRNASLFIFKLQTFILFVRVLSKS